MASKQPGNALAQKRASSIGTDLNTKKSSAPTSPLHISGQKRLSCENPLELKTKMALGGLHSQQRASSFGSGLDKSSVISSRSLSDGRSTDSKKKQLTLTGQSVQNRPSQSSIVDSKKIGQLQKRVSSFGNSPETNKLIVSDQRTRKAKSPQAVTNRPFMGKNQARPQNNLQPKPGGSRQISYSKEAEDKFDAVLAGNFGNIPPLPRSTVRIFLSSTFSDMRAERNTLAREAYPKLRDYCTELGLSFQVVDLRWGVTAEATNNHMTTKICLLELENCQKVSLGPNCIALVGNRYGFCPLPYEIFEEEFEVLMTEAKEQGTDCLKTLNTWYKKDENAIPSACYLQPITSQLPYFLDNSPAHNSQKSTDTETWARIEEEMLTIIHRAAVSACEKGRMTSQRKHFYLMSVTEHEARNGIIEVQEPNKHGLVFVRELEGLGPDTYKDTNATRHKDLIKVEDKFESDKGIESLCNSFKKDLKDCIDPANVKSYTVKWKNGGIQPDDIPEHDDYITKFCSDFVRGVKTLINADKLSKDSLIRQREYYSYYNEILHHAHFCKLKCESFCGQQETLNQIKAYISDTSNRKPFVVHAKSGTGKTSILAMAMSNLRSWIPEEHVGIIRFLGTSPLSTDIYNVLFSVCGQLADNGHVIMEPQCYRTMKGLAMYISRFFRTVATAIKKRVVIFLDSIDQLEDYYDVYSAWWLPTNLPLNFKLILSTLPEEHGILRSLQSVIGQAKNFVEVPLLPDTTCKEIVNKYLTSKKRTVSNDQMQFILKTFRKSPSPLYLKLLMDQALLWNSYTPVADLSLPDSVRLAINLLFDKLEVKFGIKFVQGALGLITVGLNGLSEIELEDALSCMDDVMTEIYKYHDPPVPGMVRVPPVLWARIRFDIQEYLVERQSQRQTTLYWYHRQFIEVAAERFAHGTREDQLHYTLFELYAAANGVKQDIILTERKNLHIPMADRNTAPQPMVSTNPRKLECLTYHMKNSVGAHDPDFVKQTTYCNLAFLRAKVAAGGVDKLIEEMEDYLKVIKDSEIEAVLKFVMLCKTSLKDALSCACSVVAYIRSSSLFPNLEFLKTTAKNYLQNLPKILLIPTFACLAPRTGEPEKIYDSLAHVFGYRNEIVLFANKWDIQCEETDPAIDQSVTLAWLDMTTTDLTKHDCDQINSEPYITADGKDLFYLTSVDTALVRVSIEGGHVTKIPLSGVFAEGGLQSKRLSLSDCIISGSADAKLLVMSAGSAVSVLEYPSLKPVVDLKQPDGIRISNLHCCNGPDVTIIVTAPHSDPEAPSVHGLVLFWNATTKEMNRQTKTKFNILPNASGVTLGDEYHVCYGNTHDKHFIQVTKVKLAEAFQPITVNHEIKSMRVSHIDQEVFFQIGDTALHVLKTDIQEFKKCLEHGVKIVAFDIAWDEDRIIVADANNRLILYNKEFEKLMSRSGHFGRVQNVSLYRNYMLLHTRESKVKLWIKKEFFAAGSARRRTTVAGDVGKGLDMQDDITCFVLSKNSEELITLGKNKICQVWSLEEDILLREFKLGMTATKLLLGVEDKIIAYDRPSQKAIVFCAEDGITCCENIPLNVLCLTLTRDKSKLVLLVRESSKAVLHLYDLKTSTSTKKITLRMNFKCDNVELWMTPSERYAVIMYEVTAEDYKAIVAMWNKGAKFPEQRHPFRFTAFDITQDTGAPTHVYFRLSKVPQLGVTMEPYKGNTMMVSSRRWIMFWDIPTGNCDQFMCKSTRLTKMYRPDWLGQNCVGSNSIITISDNNNYVAVGSQDGYVFVYEAETGMPVGMKAPSSSHPSPVNQMCFNHSCTLVASACTGGYLKLWQPRTGTCVFSISVGHELRQMEFSPDGNKLVAVTEAEKSHVLIFKVQEHTG